MTVLLDEDVVRATFRELLKRSSGQPTASLERLRKVLSGLAKDRLADQPEVVACLKASLSRVPALRPGMTDKNAAFLREVADEATRSRLLNLPARLFARALRRTDEQPHLALRDAQAAIAVEILLMHGLRRTNLCALQWSRHITWPTGAAAPTILFIPGEETKNGAPITKAIGKALGSMLAAYRRELMPKLIPGDSDALFCRPDGTPLGADSIANRIGDTLWREVGVRMTMHQFRHLAATLILDDNPGAYELAGDHLGHSSSDITARYYCGQRGPQASQYFGDLLEERRARGVALAETLKRGRGTRPTRAAEALRRSEPANDNPPDKPGAAGQRGRRRRAR